jgi:hypothetical protein
MVGDIFLNFTRDKILNVNVKDADAQEGVEVGIENGNVELQVRFSKKQIAVLRAALEKY